MWDRRTGIRNLGRRSLLILFAAALVACGGGGRAAPLGPGVAAAPADAGLDVVLASVIERAEPTIADGRDVGAVGSTYDELAAALHLPLDEERLPPAMNALDRTLAHGADDAVRYAVANRLWGQRGTAFLLPPLDAMVEHFGAPVVAADFDTDSEAARTFQGRSEGEAVLGRQAGLRGC